MDKIEMHCITALKAVDYIDTCINSMMDNWAHIHKLIGTCTDEETKKQIRFTLSLIDENFSAYGKHFVTAAEEIINIYEAAGIGTAADLMQDSIFSKTERKEE